MFPQLAQFTNLRLLPPPIFTELKILGELRLHVADEDDVGSVWPRIKPSCLPSNDQRNSRMCSAGKSVICLPGEPSMGCDQRLSVPALRTAYTTALPSGEKRICPLRGRSKSTLFSSSQSRPPQSSALRYARRGDRKWRPRQFSHREKHRNPRSARRKLLWPVLRRREPSSGGCRWLRPDKTPSHSMNKSDTGPLCRWKSFKIAAASVHPPNVQHAISFAEDAGKNNEAAVGTSERRIRNCVCGQGQRRTVAGHRIQDGEPRRPFRIMRLSRIQANW